MTHAASSKHNTTPLVIKHLLTTGITRRPQQEVVYSTNCRLSYRELSLRIARLGSALRELGVAPGHTVGLMEWDSHRYLECYFAVPMLGAVLHTLNIRLTPEQTLYTINHAEDDVIIINSDFLPMLNALHEHILRPIKFILVDEQSTGMPAAPTFVAEYEQLLLQGDPDFQFPDVDEDSRATMFYTTGTTGDPKGVYFTHRQLVLHTLALQGTLTGAGQGHIHANDVYMPLTPMFHVHAWGMPYVATLLGLKQVYPGRYQAAAILDLIQAEGVTFSHCVPTVLQMVLTVPNSQSVDLSRWTVVIGGSALSKSLAVAAVTRGIDIFGGYGLSETCPVLTLSQLTPEIMATDAENQLACRCLAGRPIPFVSIRIVDEAMHDLPHDGSTQGEIVVRAPWLTPGYFKDPDNSATLWRGGWLHTGDIGYITADGYLKITDRKKDVIKTGGEWVSSLALEEILLQHPSVGEAAVIAVDDEKWGERPIALVVSVPGTTVDEQALLQLIRASTQRGELPRYALLHKIVIVKELPKTSVGKLDKKRMRQEWRLLNA